MQSRRTFLKSTSVLGAIAISGSSARAATALAAEPVAKPGSENDRDYWVSVLDRITKPVLENLARRELRAKMPVEEQPGANRKPFSHLEAFGRLLCGIGPWLGATDLTGKEADLQKTYLQLTRLALDSATSPQSPDFLNFSDGSQALVDSAFLAQGILRAGPTFWMSLEPRVREQTIAALKSSRKIATPTSNNWVLFAATVEAALLEWGEPTLPERLEECVRKMLGWYLGDGAYGDGELAHFDYYNSFVIHPMLIDVLAILRKHDASFAATHRVELQRARRFAQVQERLIAPDGSYPPIGRSITYRFGAFQTLSEIARLGELPEPIKPPQVRCALTAVIRRMIEAPGTFDASGWLKIGFCGHQPSLGERYISTGSLYLCSAVLLPLGLPATHAFWADPPAKWTQQQLWAGEDLKADHAMADVRKVEVPTLRRTPQTP